MTKLAMVIIYNALLYKDYTVLESVCRTSPKMQSIVRKYFKGTLRRRCIKCFGPNAFQKEISKYWSRFIK